MVIANAGGGGGGGPEALPPPQPENANNDKTVATSRQRFVCKPLTPFVAPRSFALVAARLLADKASGETHSQTRRIEGESLAE